MSPLDTSAASKVRLSRLCAAHSCNVGRVMSSYALVLLVPIFPVLELIPKPLVATPIVNALPGRLRSPTFRRTFMTLRFHLIDEVIQVELTIAEQFALVKVIRW